MKGSNLYPDLRFNRCHGDDFTNLRLGNQIKCGLIFCKLTL